MVYGKPRVVRSRVGRVTRLDARTSLLYVGRNADGSDASSFRKSEMIATAFCED